MKLTLEIPNEHAPALLALLSALMPVRLEPQADPAEGHPELPLMPAEQYMAARMAEGELEEIGSLNTPDLAAKWIAAGGDVPPTPEQLAAMSRLPDEDPTLADVRWQATPESAPEPDPWDMPQPTEPDEFNSDSTRRVIEWPLEISVTDLPDLPEGKTQWVYRGTFEGKKYECSDDRSVFFYSSASNIWLKSLDFSTSFHHIEAI